MTHRHARNNLYEKEKNTSFRWLIPLNDQSHTTADERRLPHHCSIVGTSQQVLPHTICKKGKLAAKNYYYFFVYNNGGTELVRHPEQ
jgi:hypothetical protein